MKIAKNLMVVGMAMIMTGAMAGCGEVPYMHTSPSGRTQSILSKHDAFIVVEENGVYTLHKGDIYIPYVEYGYGGAQAGLIGFPMTPELKFNCGEEAATFQYVYYPTLPAETAYTKVCSCAESFTSAKPLSK